MKYLIGDIGNTSTKISILSRNFQILRSYNFDTSKIHKSNPLKNIIRKKTNKNINPVFLFSSVVPKVFMNIKKSFKSTKFKILEIKNLSQATALLPLISLKSNQPSYGKNTIEAINAGFVWGYEGLINNIIDKIISRSKIKYKILLTGGYANFFNKMIKKKVIIDQDITIKGIANAYKELI